MAVEHVHWAEEDGVLEDLSRCFLAWDFLHRLAALRRLIDEIARVVIVILIISVTDPTANTAIRTLYPQYPPDISTGFQAW
jgi:hypothetical protein